MLSCRLKIPRLHPGAIPSQFPNCPSYLSKPSEMPRPSRNEILQNKEELNLAKALQQSKEEELLREKQDLCESFDEIKRELVLELPWRIIFDEKEIIIYNIHKSDQLGPQIKAAICISEDLFLTVFCNSVKLTKVGKTQLPLKV